MTDKEKTILHLDMNNFYASVECLRHPEIAHLPVAVAGRPENRHGVVLAKNMIAKELKVKTGDTVVEARRKAPDIVFVAPDFAEYDRISKLMFNICYTVSDQVEPFGADECWIDCTASTRFGSGKELADSLRQKVKTELGLTASVGVSFTKIFAKLGSDMKKPDATTVIDRNNYREKVWPLDIGEMCGIGPRIAARLHHMNINTLGQLAIADERILRDRFGKIGIDLKRNAAGEEIATVREADREREAKSIGHSVTARRDIITIDDLRLIVFYLSELIAKRMEKHGVRADKVSLWLRHSDLTHVGRQTCLPDPVRSSVEIAEAVMALCREMWDGKPLRSVGISMFGLSDCLPPQISFFERKENEHEKLDDAINRLKHRFGNSAVIRGAQLNTDLFLHKDVGDFLPFKR